MCISEIKLTLLDSRYPIDSLPPDELGYRQWLCQIWKEKEESLIEFHKKQSFPQVRITACARTESDCMCLLSGVCGWFEVDWGSNYSTGERRRGFPAFFLCSLKSHRTLWRQSAPPPYRLLHLLSCLSYCVNNKINNTKWLGCSKFIYYLMIQFHLYFPSPAN